MNIEPFKIDIPDSALEELKQRLALTRWPDTETVEDWSQGTPLSYMKEVVDYWQTGYDWRKVEAELNALPQYKATVQGLPIYFIHIRSPEPTARPLIMTHGWPGSVLEFMKVLGPLTDPKAHGGAAEDAFHVVCPALPGYGFSGKPQTAGWGVEKIADAWSELMVGLGYERYFAQGGDWGAIVTQTIALRDTTHCAAIHTNMPIVTPPADMMDDLTEKEQKALQGMQFYQQHDSGYSKQQSTRPQTVGYGLVDSPVGQAAWILEKFYQWMDCDGHPENVVSRDELLDNVMMYWLTGSGASSARLYWESFGGSRNDDPVTIPAGISQFPKEIFGTSKRWAETRFKNLVHYNELPKGGHFAAFEQPALFVGEVRTALRGIEP